MEKSGNTQPKYPVKYPVPDQPRCGRLKQLGFPQLQSMFHYTATLTHAWELNWTDSQSKFLPDSYIAAPTTDEMVEWLSKQYDNHMKIRPLIAVAGLTIAISTRGKYECELWRWDGKILYGNTVGADTLANAVCDTVLWVLEKGREK